MEIIEFSVQIENGVIQLPKELEQYKNAFVRIALWTEKPLDLRSKKERLREIMLKMGEKNIFSNIADGVKWQKQIRNEWD